MGYARLPFTYWSLRGKRVKLGSYHLSGFQLVLRMLPSGVLTGTLKGRAAADLIEPPGPRSWEVAVTLRRTTCETFE